MERFNIEKADGGTGITIGKVYIATYCNVILIIMAIIFLLVGVVLTAISYRPKDPGEHMTRFLDRQEWSWQTKIFGPSFLTIGFLMLIAGLGLCIISWKVSKDEKDNRYLQSRISHVHSAPVFTQTQIEHVHCPFMPTISQAVPVGLLSPDLPTLIPVNVLASIPNSSQQHLLTSSLDSATLAFDWTNLKPRRANSLQFPINEDQHQPEMIVINVTDVSPEKQRRKSLPAFSTSSSPPSVTSKRSRPYGQKRRESLTRQAVKISGVRNALETGKVKAPVIPIFLRSVSTSSGKARRDKVSPESMSKYQCPQISNGQTSPPAVLKSSNTIPTCHCSKTVEVAPANSNQDPYFLQVDPYPLLQSPNVMCESLPRIDVTSHGSPGKLSGEQFSYLRSLQPVCEVITEAENSRSNSPV